MYPSTPQTIDPGGTQSNPPAQKEQPRRFDAGTRAGGVMCLGRARVGGGGMLLHRLGTLIGGGVVQAKRHRPPLVAPPGRDALRGRFRRTRLVEGLDGIILTYIL